MKSIKIKKEPCILAFGSEGRGLSPEITKRADKVFYIPIDPLAESLNVTAAAAISMHYFSQARGEL